MKATYGAECPKHPELKGRRYLANNACLECHTNNSRASYARKMERIKARDERLAKCEALLRELVELDDNAIEPLIPLTLYLAIEEVLDNEQ